MSALYKSFFSTLWYTSLPCFDLKGITSEKDGQRSILKFCKWNGLALPCSAIFSTFPTERGMCCSFNMKAAKDIFRGETYSKLIQDLQQSDKNNSFETGQLPSSNVYNNEPKTQPGRNRGLTVVLDAHADIFSVGSVEVDNSGFMGLIQQTGSFPMTTFGAFDIKPGHKNIVALTGTVIKSAPELQNLNPVARNCLFRSENPQLKIYRNYSQSNCLFECSLYFAQKTIQNKYNASHPCVPWYFPTAETKPRVCNPWEAVEFLKLMSNVLKYDCQHCLPECNLTIYKTLVTAVPLRNCSLKSLNSIQFCNISNNVESTSTILGDLVTNSYERRYGRAPNYMKNAFRPSNRSLGQSLVNGHYFGPSDSDYNPFAKDISIVQIFFKTATVVECGRQPVMTWIDFFSNIGGILGLVFGVGLLTVIELVWLFFQIGKQK